MNSEILNLPGGKRLRIKQAPANTPEKLKPFMRVLETLREHYRSIGIKKGAKELAIEAGELYRKMKS